MANKIPEQIDTLEVLFVIFFVICIIVGLSDWWHPLLSPERELYEGEVIQREAVQRGYAHYDSVTGKWQWNDKVKTKGEGE